MKTRLLIIIIMSCVINFVKAQDPGKPIKYIYYSVDGNVIPKEKIDSVYKSMVGSITFKKEVFGDDSVVMRFVWLPDRILKENEARLAKRSEFLSRLLGSKAKNFI